MQRGAAGFMMWLVCSGFAAGLDLARPFGDHMVLPHGVRCPVWGRAEAGAAVEVRFGNHLERTRCGADGVWRVVLPAMPPAADARDLTVIFGDRRTVARDVLVGEVWLASGQSNMDFPLARAVGGKAEAAKAAELPSVRLFNLTGVPTDNREYGVAELGRLTAESHFGGVWQVASAESAGAVSAIAWWTGKAIHLQRKVPVGIVENAVGGSGAEAWLPREVLGSRAEYSGLLDDGWLDSGKIGAWARGRARRNLGSNTAAMHPFRPGFLFESGVSWWRGFPFAGVLWYQGETNAEVPDDAWNQRLIEDLVIGWRAGLDRRDLPFFMVQLPRIGGADPLRRFWPEFRAVQARAANRLSRVRLIVTEDLGWDSPDVHPPDKLPVARRLAEAVQSP
jgi:sialate O-acetylesterase